MSHTQLQYDFKLFMKKFTDRVEQDCLNAGIKPLTLRFPGEHFFQRAVERKVDKAVLGGLFTKLLRHHSCELIFLAIKEGHDVRNFVDKPKTICVTYKTLKVLLHILKTEDNYQVVAVTALGEGMRNDNSEFFIEIVK